MVGSGKVRSHHHHETVCQALLFGIVPQVVDRIREVSHQPSLVRIVIVVRVEAAQAQVCADRDANRER